MNKFQSKHFLKNNCLTDKNKKLNYRTFSLKKVFIFPALIVCNDAITENMFFLCILHKI